MIHEFNAYRYNDNFAIECESTGQVVGVEHNSTEAKAIATYLTNYHGRVYRVIQNSREDVKKARSIRPQVVRVADRELILKQMGVW